MSLIGHKFINFAEALFNKGRTTCTYVDQNLIADQRNFSFGVNIYLMMRKTELTSRSTLLNITSYFIYTDLISSFLGPRLVDFGSTLIYGILLYTRSQNIFLYSG